MKNMYATKKEMQQDYDEQMTYYCLDCGTKMKLKKFISFYDPSTGEPYYELEGTCSNARWWKFGHAKRIYTMPIVGRMKQGDFGTHIL